MSTQINEQLKDTGVAQVIAILKSPPPVEAPARLAASVGAVALDRAPISPSLSGLEKFFQASELSINTQISDAGLANVARFRGAASLTHKPRKSAPPPPVHMYPNLGIMLGTVTREGLAGLRADDRIAAVTAAPQLSLIKPIRVAAARLQTRATWGIDLLRIPALWKEGLSGKGVRVAHLDTGADGKHPALKSAISVFAEFDSFGRLAQPAPNAYDTGEHGTHTAGTIAGRAVQGKAIGVAPGAELASAIVIEGGNVVARVLGGMDWALSQGIKLLSMSLGFPGFLGEFIPIIGILRARNVLPVIAIGNEGPGRTRSPGNYPDVLSVGAINEQGVIAPFSSSQRFTRKIEPIVPDLVAPGVDVISARPGGGFQSMDGSSMATPHIAGLATLLFEAKPDAAIDAVEKAILDSCKLGSGMTADRGGRGVPDAVRALAALTGIQLAKTEKALKKSAKTELAKKATRQKARTKRGRRQ